MIVLTFGQPGQLLNLNDRMHWAKKASITRAWRTAAYTAARSAHVPELGRTLVTITLPVRSLKVRRDPSNFIATLKPCIDGLVDAGVWRDDSSAEVVTAEPRFAQSDRLVTLTLEPLEQASAA